MFSSIEHGKSDTLHAVAHRLGLIGLLLTERIEALLATRQLVGVHIRRGGHGHDQLDDITVLLDGSGQIDILDIALEPNGSERFQDGRIIFTRVSIVVRAIEVTGFTIDCHCTGNEIVIVLTIDFDPDIRHKQSSGFFRLRSVGDMGTLLRLETEAFGHGVEKFGDGLRTDNVGTDEKRGKGTQGLIGRTLLIGIFDKSRKQGDWVDYGAAVGDIGYVLESLNSFP